MKCSMKYLFAGALVLICMGETMADSFTDSRDGQTYKTVKIGKQTWMAENLNVNVEGSVCYENNPANCDKYGRLYTWEITKNVCPDGWHLPSKEEMETFIEAVKVRVDQIVTQKKLDAVPLRKGEDKWYNHLRDTSWKNGFDSFGFSALPAGGYDGSEVFAGLDFAVAFQSSTEHHNHRSYHLAVGDSLAIVEHGDKSLGMSVRCIQDDSSCSIDVGSLNTSKARATIKTPGKEEITIVEAGSRSVADVLKVVKQRTPGLRHIYDKFVKKNKSCFQGKVALKLTIDSSGYITNVSIASSTTGTGEFDNEIKTAVSKWRFNNVASGNTVVTIPFVFDIRK